MLEFRTAADFWSGMVEPDFAECLSNPADLRAAFHAASFLFHMHDWVWQTHKAAVQASYSIRANIGDKEGAIAFANALGKQCPSFARIRDIANAAKHLKIGNPPKHAVDTSVRTIPALGGYGVGTIHYGVSGYYGGGQRVVFAGPAEADIPFLQIARTVYGMWTALRAKRGW
jgi:hypothetical protein